MKLGRGRERGSRDLARVGRQREQQREPDRLGRMIGQAVPVVGQVADALGVGAVAVRGESVEAAVAAAGR